MSLFGHVTNLALVVGQIIANVDILEENNSGGGLEKSGHDFHCGALARSVGPKITEHFSFPNCETDIRNGGNRTVGFRERPHFEHVTVAYYIAITARSGSEN